MNEKERIELLMKSYGMTPSQFADRTGIQRASVSHIISGRNKPSLEVLQKIYEAFPELDIKWLMTGVGEEPVTGGVAEDNVAARENSLFPQDSLSAPVQQDVQEYRSSDVQNSVLLRQTKTQPVQRSLQRKAPAAQKMRQQPVQERRVKEIRIFYTDGTYETMFPEK